MEIQSHPTAHATSGARLRFGLAAFLVTTLALPMHQALAAGNDFTLPTVPLQSGTNVPPNIMFILDDSGSMQFELLPDELIKEEARYMFPRVWRVYGGTDYNNHVPTFNSTNPYALVTRSSHFNPAYYNPAVTYRPWVRIDGNGRYPDAPIAAAPHNPTLDKGTRNLTQDNVETARWASCTSGTNCSLSDSASRTFFPAVYAHYTGSNAWNEPDWTAANFQWTEIKSGNAPFTGHGRAARTDCTNGSCTYAQEIQNFANWYTYYRSRILASRGGIAEAFSSLPPDSEFRPAPRVGYASINTSGTVLEPVRPFTGTARETFFTRLYTDTISRSGTPLRKALDDIGRYYENTTNQNDPWRTGVGDTSHPKYNEYLTCRQSFSILMTDGYWNGSITNSVGNADGDAGAPFQDSHSDTLADFAYHYWSRDLRDTIANNVPTSSLNSANWQHMVTFGVGLGVFGSIDDADAVFAKIGAEGEAANQTWNNPTDADRYKIDDLLHAGVNSRGGFFSASDPNTFAERLTDTLTNINERVASGSNVAANSVALREETRIFQASYIGGAWTGELASYRISQAGVEENPVWRASAASNYANRNILTFNGTDTVGRHNAFPTTGVGATFPNTAQNTVFATVPGVADYLKGSAAQEQRNNGPFRNRTTLLGDIIHSSPLYVAGDDERPGMLYVGSNAGMLHAYQIDDGIGEPDENGVLFQEREVFAYVPGGINPTTLMTLADPNYAHRYFVDGSIAVSREAHTPEKRILVGTMGRGSDTSGAGSVTGVGAGGIFALDVTDPGSMNASKVLWDSAAWRAGNGNNNPDPRLDLGVKLSEPMIVRTNDGKASAIFGNGINSQSGDPVLFVVELETGKITRVLRARTDTMNGIVSTRALDIDNDGVHDFVYAADIKGNMWKFDLTGNTNGWGLTTGGDPLFTTPSGQPITGGFAVTLEPQSFEPWVIFGTGKYLEAGDVASTTQQAWYGIADQGQQVTLANLKQRSINVATSADGTLLRGFEPFGPLPTEQPGPTPPGGDVPVRGWYLNLEVPSGGSPAERMIGNPLVLGRVVVNASVFPSADPCEAGGTGYLNAIDAFTGTSVQVPFFDVNGDGSFDQNDYVGTGDNSVPVGSIGVNVGMPTSPTVVENLLVVGGSRGATDTVGINNPLLKGRVSWRELIRN